jgi:hypothetical protein
MLYRFRETKAMELGLVSRTDRRPRIASTCKDLRQCERWRGEILREISRKVSKIQDCAVSFPVSFSFIGTLITMDCVKTASPITKCEI